LEVRLFSLEATEKRRVTRPFSNRRKRIWHPHRPQRKPDTRKRRAGGELSRTRLWKRRDL